MDLPAGFVLDSELKKQPQQPMELPEGFVLDNAQAQEQPQERGMMDKLIGGVTDPDEWKRQLGLTARHAVEGVASIPNLVADPLALASDKYLGTDFGSQTQNVSDALTRLGLPQPEGALERGVGGVSRAVSGAGSSVATGARMLKDVAKTGTDAMAKQAPSMGKFLTVEPTAQLGGAIGAGGASETAREMGASPAVQLGAGLVGGLAGGHMGMAKSKPSPIPNADDLRVKAHGLYAEAEKAGGVLKPQFMDDVLDDLHKITPQTEAGTIMSGENPLSKVIKRMELLRGKPVSLRAAQEIDEGLGDVIDGLVDMGRLTKQGKKVLDVQDAFRKQIARADKSVLENTAGFNAWDAGRKTWHEMNKMQDIERIIRRAEMTDNPATSIKTGFRTMLSNPNRIKGYTPKEVKLMEQAAKSGVVSDMMRTVFGSRLLPIITGATGGLGATATAQGASMASRGMANKLQFIKASKVAREVAKDSMKPQRTNNLLKRIYEDMNNGIPIATKDIMKLPSKDAKEVMGQLKKVGKEWVADESGAFHGTQRQDITKPRITKGKMGKAFYLTESKDRAARYGRDAMVSDDVISATGGVIKREIREPEMHKTSNVLEYGLDDLNIREVADDREFRELFKSSKEASQNAELMGYDGVYNKTTDTYAIYNVDKLNKIGITRGMSKENK